jgi:hypothetical protein
MPDQLAFTTADTEIQRGHGGKLKAGHYFSTGIV